jgi:hypothetical protein
MYSSIEDSEVLLVFERNNGGLKKLSSFVWTASDSSAFLNAMSSNVCTQLWTAFFSYFDPDYPTPRLNLNGLLMVYCISKSPKVLLLIFLLSHRRICVFSFFLCFFCRHGPLIKIYLCCILWHIDPLLGDYHEISSYTTAVASAR